jgi:addiction module RelB/DinJ family antitoxin
MAKTQIQIRTDEDIKEKATVLFEQLGLNISDAVNLFLRQSIFANGLPFEVKLPDSHNVKTKEQYAVDTGTEKPIYTREEIINEVKASMAIEGLNMTEKDIDILRNYQKDPSSRESIRQSLLSQYTQQEDKV